MDEGLVHVEISCFLIASIMYYRYCDKYLIFFDIVPKS
jgi:hypothetical protein